MNLRELILLTHALETLGSVNVSEEDLKERGLELTDESAELIQAALRKMYNVSEDCADEEMHAHETRLMQEMREVAIDIVVSGFEKIEKYLSEQGSVTLTADELRDIHELIRKVSVAEAENAYLQEQLSVNNQLIDQLVTSKKECTDRMKQYEAVLQYYANVTNYRHVPDAQARGGFSVSILRDRGEQARTVLEGEFVVEDEDLSF